MNTKKTSIIIKLGDKSDRVTVIIQTSESLTREIFDRWMLFSRNNLISATTVWRTVRHEAQKEETKREQ